MQKSGELCCYVGYLLLLTFGLYNRGIVKKAFIFEVLVCAVAICSFASAKQLVLVADKDSTTTNIKSADLANIFTAHTRTWQDGKTIKIVMRDPSSEDAQLVLRRILNMTTEQARSFIQAHPGVIVVADSDDAILHFVSNNRGAIGVIDLYSLTKDVNVVKIDGKLPLEPGYLLKGN
jgi:ABC-type phosphate transport system substrate-binding protein